MFTSEWAGSFLSVLPINERAQQERSGKGKGLWLWIDVAQFLE